MSTIPSLSSDQVDEARRHLGNALLLFLTDRCPVGCAHCSVDSTARGSSIVDRGLFIELLSAVCDHPRYNVVGITGGEPFVERWGLEVATARLESVGKQVVLYTSAIWATDPHASLAWERTILQRAATVVLSSDAFHSRRVSLSDLRRGVDLVLQVGAQPVIQYLRLPGGQAPEIFMTELLGAGWSQLADLKVIELVNEGRAAKHGLWKQHRTVLGEAMGSCNAIQPTVRYDGVVTRCCNANVMMGRGPAALRCVAATKAELSDVLDAIVEDSWLRFVALNGLGPLTNHPDAGELGKEAYASPCDLCWKLFASVDTRSPLTRGFLGLVPDRDPAVTTQGTP